MHEAHAAMWSAKRQDGALGKKGADSAEDWGLPSAPLGKVAINVCPHGKTRVAPVARPHRIWLSKCFETGRFQNEAAVTANVLEERNSAEGNEGAHSQPMHSVMAGKTISSALESTEGPGKSWGHS